MNLFLKPTTKKFLFASLYLSEGAPIGFLWMALPVRLRTAEVPIEQITTLLSILVLPWTLKFLWAPLIDWLSGERWSLRHWVLAAQCMMGLTLLPLLWFDTSSSFSFLAGVLLSHAFAAATQDVAIDALCISTTRPGERGQYNGWMQCGMLLGRALMGGGALVMFRYLPFGVVILLLISLTMFSALLLFLSVPPRPSRESASESDSTPIDATFLQSFLLMFRERLTWIGLAYALFGGAAFKALDVLDGPFLVDRGYDETSIGWYALGPKIGAMIFGSLAGGWLTDRIGSRRCVVVSMLAIIASVSSLTAVDQLSGGSGGLEILALLTVSAVGIGAFTSSSYALFMDITYPRIAASQFSAFMGATNGCESWSIYVAGLIIPTYGYGAAFLLLCGASLGMLPLVRALSANVADRSIGASDRPS